METRTAKEMIEMFFSEGHYAKKQILAAKEQDLKDQFRSILTERDASEAYFNQKQLVAFYHRRPSYEVDLDGLKEYLYDTGLLAKVATFPTRTTPSEVKALIEPFAVKKGTVRVNPNKHGRVHIPTMNFAGMDHEELGTEFLETYRMSQFFQGEFDRLKDDMVTCSDLLSRGKVMHEYGSLSYGEKVLFHKSEDIANVLGMDFLLEHAAVNFERLNNLSFKGMISKGEIDSFRKIKDVRADFIVQPTAVRQRIMQHMVDRREYLRTS